MGSRASHDPRERHWHVGPISVRPELQGKGAGKALLSSFLATADEQGMPVFLETDVDKNVALDEKFGFKVVGVETILGVCTRLMWRGSPGGRVTQKDLAVAK
jgi:GNAT superfamily N-acetyltransferase